MASPLYGQVAVTGTAQPLSATPANSVAFTFKASSANVNPVFIGSSVVTTGTGFQLDPGDSIDYGRNDQHGSPSLQLQISDFYVIGTAGSDKLSWLATP